MIRTGFGYDCHRFTQGDHLVIGGEKISFHQGIEAHSDGDVLLHAICDALLGAAGLGDIGRHYPDTDPQFRDIKSALLLERVARKIEEDNYITGKRGQHRYSGSTEIGRTHLRHADQYQQGA